MKSLSKALNGVYRAPDQTMATQARSSGLRFTVVSLRGIDGKKGVLGAFARALDFPSGFGANWDALADCLQDLSWLPGGHLLLLQAGADFAETAFDECEMLLDILASSADFWRQRDRVFIVWVDGIAGLPEFVQS